MTEQDYLLAWAAYALAALGCLLVWLKLTGWMWRWLREPLRVLVMVLLASPTVVDAERGLLAPSIAITAMDLLLKTGNNAWRAAADLSLYTLLALAADLVFALLRWPIERSVQRRRTKAAARAEDPRTLRELLAEEDDQARFERREPRI